MNIESALLNYIESKQGVAFEFGVNDCPLFVAGAIDTMHKTDLESKYRGKWHDKKSAWKYAKKNGEIQGHLRELGCVEVGFNFVQLGDIIIMQQKLAHQKSWKSAAVCIGDKTAVMTTEGLKVVNNAQLPNIVEVLRWV